MKLMRHITAILVLLTFGAQPSSADEAADYKIFVDETREAVYSMDLPAFDVREIPARYRDESAVYVAVYNELDARKKTGFGHLPGTLRFSRKARVEGGELYRVLVYVNDKAALEKFSEFDFATDMKKKMSNAHRRQRHTMGVRVIKPDGRIVDVDTGEFVDVENGEERRRKLAVPGLETGDMLDVFFYTEHKLQNVHLEPYYFRLRDEYPIMDYTVRLVVDDNLTTQYRTLYGAPDFTVSRDEDKNYVLDMHVTDMPAEPGLWYSEDQQTPQVRVHVYNRRSDAYTPVSARKDGLQQNPPAAKIIGDFWSGRATLLPYSGRRFVKDEIRNGEKAYKNIQKQFKSGAVDSVQAADYIYNLLTLAYFVSDDDLYPLVFDCQFLDMLHGLFKDGTVSFVTTDDEEEPLDSAISLYNATGGTKLRNCSRFYLPPRSIIAPSELYPGFAGRKAQVYDTESYRKKHPEVDTVFFTLPEATARDNRNVTTVRAEIDGNMLDIVRRESYLGATKLGVRMLLTEDDIVSAYLAALTRDGLELGVKEKAKKAADRAGRNATARELQADEFREEVEAYHGEAPADSCLGRIVSAGVDPAAPELIYEVGYRMDGLVRRAGNNLMLSVGKLFSNQRELTVRDRERIDDIVSLPREFVTDIEVAVPAGYTVPAGALEALRSSVKNDAGEFSATPRIDGDKLKVTVVKRYDHSRLPVAQWADVLAIADAAFAWQSQTIMLEKH